MNFMYKQECKSGIREFLTVVVMALVSVILSQFLGALLAALTGGRLPTVLTGQLILAVMCVYMIFLVYHHYASHFTYTINKKHIVIQKRTGRRETEMTIPLNEIMKVYLRKKPKLKGKKQKFCTRMFPSSKTSTLICGDEGKIIVFEPDDKFIEKMKEYMND